MPVTDVVKLYVLPTIVALALGANARAKAAAKYGARILMSFPPFNRAGVPGFRRFPDSRQPMFRQNLCLEMVKTLKSCKINMIGFPPEPERRGGLRKL